VAAAGSPQGLLRPGPRGRAGQRRARRIPGDDNRRRRRVRSARARGCRRSRHPRPRAPRGAAVAAARRCRYGCGGWWRRRRRPAAGSTARGHRRRNGVRSARRRRSRWSRPRRSGAGVPRTDRHNRRATRPGCGTRTTGRNAACESSLRRLVERDWIYCSVTGGVARRAAHPRAASAPAMPLRAR